ncbi:hypothetical protein C8Q80DRAFT_1281926 [Daedaleopsis nitida]|nr:hypothetical protein C8Q80DRAFT_1281926 [Daedaleopsis nitida]
MASIDQPSSAQHSEKEDHSDAGHADIVHTSEVTAGGDGLSEPGKGSGGRSRDASPASQSSALSSNKGGTHSPAPGVSSASTPPLSMPHPKRFSHVNINKKFLEKTSSASTPTHTLSASPIPKMTNMSQKAVPQTTGAHSRLITAKLTATPQPSTTGWSRPSSAVPSNVPTPLPMMSSKSTSSATSSSMAPLPPPVGKVFQPQPRSNQDVHLVRKDSATKPAWGNAKGGTFDSLDRVHADFPTAAEVAQSRILKASEKASLADAAIAHKQAVISELMAEEDTFRGVHLNPNAHHWDEMEEDDDNFLGGVIEFGDGRQYKVQSNAPTRQSSPPRDTSKSLSAVDSATTAPHEVMDQPVSKEERFEDDFDRSWPRSRPGSHQVPGPSRDQRSVGSTTSPSSTSVHSPQESSSRVLFNERSNRLEPYSHQRHGGPGAPVAFNRRSTRSDYSSSPTESRRDVPPHTHPHILQKGPGGGSQLMESPTSSRAPGDRSPVSPHDGFRSRDRQPMPMRRDHPPWQSNGLGAFGDSVRSPRDGTFDDRARRSSTMEHPSGPGGDTRHVPPIRTDHDYFPPPPSAPPPSIPPPHEPSAPSACSQTSESPVAPSSVLPTTDVEDVRKAAMHSAAERARLRRQQEEEEREKEKERARRKAAEIEERMKAAEQAKALEREKAEGDKQETEAQVLSIIEQAVSSFSISEKMERSDAASQHIRPAVGRAPSSKGSTRPPAPRRPSLTATTSIASEVDTWRRKNPPIVPSTPVERPAEESASQAPPILTATLAHANLEVKEGEDVDIVDFADLGKLVGSEATSQQTGAPPPRARASDFFSDETPLPPRPPPLPSKADEGPWRRRPSFAQGHGLPEKPEEPVLFGSLEAKATAPIPLAELSGPMHVMTPQVSSQPPPEEHRRRISGSYPNGIHKPVPSPHYREAPMSTLNDTMARIKGAIAGMHHDIEVPKEAPKPQKWLPPALRPKTAEDYAQPTEVFDVTAAEPPKSPKRAWNTFTVKIARDTRPLQPPSKVELVWPRGQRYFRLEACSWRPPTEALARRDMSVNEYLHGGPRLFKGKPKYFVALPKTRLSRRPRADATPASPIVNLPTTPPRLRNGSTSENTAPSWRKLPSSPTSSWRPSVHPAQVVGLNTVSRSPPPEAPPTKAAVPVSSTTSPAANPTANSVPAAASDVTFYRTARLQPAAEPMKFVVSSELASESKLGLIGAETGHTTGLERTNGITTSPQSQSSLWPKSPKAFKEPTSRAPDPEHLKAIWEQTPEKAQVQPVNSLKSIADDFNGVPLQDVKPVGGETPPPSGSGPWTRMSAYDVTRAFQQVPTPSSSSTQRPAAIAPPHANGTAPRNPTFTFSPPPMAQPQPQSNPNLRPAYPYSPMMSTPNSAVMYTHPSPVPRPMVVNGGSPGYGQPVWMPAMPGPPPQPGGMMRSPYPPQLVPYPSHGNAVPMYPSPMPNMQNPSQQNGAQGRPPGMPMVSPVMQPALPQMYAGSPVLVHAPPMQPGQAYPVPGQPNRGPMRPYEQNPGGPHMHSPMRPPPQSGYNPIPSSYARPPW